MILLLTAAQAQQAASVNCTVTTVQSQSITALSGAIALSDIATSQSQGMSVVMDMTLDCSVTIEQGQSALGELAAQGVSIDCTVSSNQGQEVGGTLERWLDAVIATNQSNIVSSVLMTRYNSTAQSGQAQCVYGQAGITIVMLQTLAETVDMPISYIESRNVAPYLTHYYDNNKIGNETFEQFATRLLKEKATTYWVDGQVQSARESFSVARDTLRAEAEVFINS